ncbi:NUDIX domain-containing protein [Candidatus Saccharibacteria bacterium]|nr:NUDIX domain-containing protein [Candidatus Saccharibacteria bacterium]
MPHIHELYDFTVSAFIMHPTEPKICLHFHRKLNFWNQLGGHIELDEDPLETLARELKEEAGLSENDYEIIEVSSQPKITDAVKQLPMPFAFPIYKYGKLAHWHIDLPYLVKAKTVRLNPQDGESQKIRWFNKDEISQLQRDGELGDTVHQICEWIFAHHM